MSSYVIRKWHVAVALAIAATTVAAGIGLTSGPDAAKKAERILVAEGSDHLPNQTASDWVTYADYVVVVSTVGEREIPPSASEVKRGEGLILRKVALRVDKVLWARPGADHAAPRIFGWTAYGWQFKNGDLRGRLKMAGHDQPRMERGHRYIMAIEWQDARCTPGDYIPGQWRGLGSDSTIPFDSNIVGQGEVEGRLQSAKLDSAALSGPNVSFEDRMTGKNASAIQQALRSAKPGKKEQFGPRPGTNTCK